VGNCDQNGLRFDTSAFLSSTQSKQLLSLYAIGKNIPFPLARTGNLFTLASGASASAAFVSGILSILMAQSPIGAPASGAAKSILQQVAMDRKGEAGWPTTEETYFVPRMATNFEIECDDGEDEDPATAKFPTFLPPRYSVTQTTIAAADYTQNPANDVSEAR
jgi:hypothetical protein